MLSHVHLQASGVTSQQNQAAFFRWIPESARWLLGQGRKEEAKKIICRVAAINKKKIPENLLEEVGQI